MLLVDRRSDEAGVGAVTQVLLLDGVEMLQMDFRVKYGSTDGELSTSVRSRNGKKRDQAVSQLIAKL